MQVAGAGLRGLLVTLALAAPAAASELTLVIRDGRVTLVAEQVTVRQILDEWARVGGTRIVNADKLAGPPISLRLENVPEGQALVTLLRSASGFVAAPRRLADQGVSRYDRILILPTSRPPAAAPPAAASPPAAAPTLRPPLITPPDPTPPPTDEPTAQPGSNAPSGRPVSPFLPPQGPTGPGEIPPFPGVQPDEDPSAAEPAAAPQVPQTMPRPGMIVAPPAAPAPGRTPSVAPGVVPPGPRRPSNPSERP